MYNLNLSESEIKIFIEKLNKNKEYLDINSVAFVLNKLKSGK